MIDIILASLVARSFGNRAKRRGRSSSGTGITVFLTIVGTEVGVGVWMAGPTFVRTTLLLWLLIGWLAGMCVGSLIGVLLTRGPLVRSPEDVVEGRECFECQKEITAGYDGVKCSGCKYTLHRRCLSEHARAHRAYEQARSGVPGVSAVEADPHRAERPERRTAATSTSSASDSLAGVECAQCQLEIVMRHQGTRCETCDEPLHRSCEGGHRTKHLGPFRRAAPGS